MFGGLFEEAEEDETPVTAVIGGNYAPKTKNIRGKSKNILAPPKERGPTKLCGLINQGGTCYLNSLIQTLFFTPEFRDKFFQIESSQLGELSSVFKARVIPLQLQRLLSELLLLNRDSISTSQLTESFGWSQNEGGQQHDVQELNRILFDAIESSLVGTSGHHLIRELYHGTVISKITCKECGQISAREEDFLDLQMTLTSCASLEQSLKMLYVNEEVMCSDNQYMCERCNKLVDATRKAKLRSLPPILTFSLVRFAYDLKNYQRFKETKRYTFPLELDMRELCEESKYEEIYELYSVVIHRGNCYGGHYHAYIKDIQQLGNWKSPILDEPSTVNYDEVDFNNPIQLIVYLIKQIGCQATISDLCQHMNNETGIAWNKTFKKKHGALTKFIKKRSDIFNVSKEGVISLKDERNGDHGIKDVDVHGNTFHTNKHPESSGCHGDKIVRSSQGNWFDFNDSQISCITENDIKKQFAGKESAYMLFYRRKSLDSTSKVQGLIENGVPANLVMEVNQKNLELKKQRNVYDLELNCINVVLHFCCDYTVKDGVIVHKEKTSIGPSVFTLDRRKTVNDFLHLVDERCLLSKQIIHDLTLHTAKQRLAGLHLYDNITVDKSRSLLDWGVTDGSELFIWCGKQVDGHYIRTGKDSEPVLLSITYPMKDGQSVDVQKAFPKDSTLNELKVSISKITGIKLSKLIISVMKLSKHAKTKIEELGTSLDETTLKDLDFVDGQRLVVDRKAKQKNNDPHCLATSEAEKRDNQIVIEVENQINSSKEDADTTFDDGPHVSTFYVDKHKTVGEFKSLVIKKEKSCILRIDDVTHGVGPPLHEHCRLGEFTQDRCKMVIELGKPLLENQVVIRFYCSVVGFPRNEQEVILDSHCTVGQSLRLMVERAGLDGSDWYLTKTNWYGEETEIIENVDDSVINVGLKHGDLVVVKRGQLLPKDVVVLSIWLYKNVPCIMRDREEHGPGMISWITMGLQDLLGVSHSTINGNEALNDLELLGDIQISVDVLLVDLKCKIVDLILQNKGYQVSLPECLRIQDIKDERPGRVVRNHNKSLRCSKINSSRKLFVQVLDSKEDLRQSEILLNVQKRVPGKRRYELSKQVIFDAPNGATPSSLSQFLSDIFGIPADNIAMAKFLRNKYEWIVISDTACSKQSKNKKNNLRHSPYHLQDGDIIGIKDKSIEDSDDFSTPEDDDKKQNLLRLRDENIRRRREEKQRGARLRRPEAELKIYVDDFTSS